MPYANRIKFNCSQYRAIMSRPANCYNCAMRDGYPFNLGGDDYCLNFKPVPSRKRKTQNAGSESQAMICETCGKQMRMHCGYCGWVTEKRESAIPSTDPFVGKFPCPLSPSDYCKHGGNKAYNYGFMRGMAPYCRKAKRWIYKHSGETIECPLANATHDGR